MAICSP